MTLPEDDMFFEGDGLPPEQPDQEPSSSTDDDATDSQVLPTEDGDPLVADEDDTRDFDFPRMDDDVAAFRRELDAIKPPSTEHFQEEPVSVVNPTARRRRRSTRITEHLSADDLGERMVSIVERATPSVDFFIFSFLCGCILGVGYILDAPAILLLGIFAAPLLGPWVGTALSAATGEIRVFRQSFGGILTGLAAVFVLGFLAGLASHFFQLQTSTQAFNHARLWWPDLLLLVIGTAILVVAFIQSDDKPVIASLMVAYELYLPVSAAGFGLASGIHGLWPQAGLVLMIHLALSLIISMIIFFYMGFRPVSAGGYVLMVTLALAGLVILAGFAGLGSLINVRGDQAYATALAAPTSTTAVPEIPNPSPTLKPSPTVAATSSRTPAPAPSPTREIPSVTPGATPTIDNRPAPTLLPTPVYGRVESQSGGVYVRVKPGGSSITTVLNGYLVEILGDTPVILEGATWVHVIIKTPARDIDGWVLLDLIVTATPSFSP